MNDYDERCQVVEQGKRLLEERFDIRITPGSLLDHSISEVRSDLDKCLKRAVIDPNEDFGPGLRETAGVVLMFERLLDAHSRGLLTDVFRPHLQLLNSGLVSQASTYRDHGIRQDDQEKKDSDKVFELTVALAAAHIGTEIQLEDPLIRSRLSSNPDVLVTIGGEQWGFPCKVMSGENIQSLFNLVNKGIQQIARSPAKHGCVVVNLRNRFDHGILNPPAYVAGSTERHFCAFPCDQLDKIVDSWFDDFHMQLFDRFADENGGNSYRELYSGSRSVLGFLGYLETAAFAVGEHGPKCGSLTYCWHLHPSNLDCTLPQAVVELQKRLAGPNSTCYAERS